jgi:hypothetical protein
MIHKVQRFIIMTCYSLAMVALSIPLVRLVTMLSPDHLYPLLAVLVLYMAGVVVLGSIIHTFIYIPVNLAREFDPIKNAIAAGQIRDLEQLGKEVTAFTTRFFDFAFLDIDHAFIQAEKTGPVSHEDISEAYNILKSNDIPGRSRKMEAITRAGKLMLNGREFHLYILPIWFKNQWLGYMGLLTRQRIGWLHRRFLTDFENQFLDDQFMHVIQRA